jgi:tetratricopeptide (TPR) repeat protein
MAGHRMGVRAPHSGRKYTALIWFVALAATGFTSLTFGGSLEEPVARDPLVSAAPVQEKNAVGAPGRPIEEDEPAFWSEVEIYKAGPGRPRPILVVKRGKQPTDGRIPGLYQGLLAREVVRQALMLSAREELGAVTRDVPVGDPEVAGKPDASFRIGSRLRLASQPVPSDPRGCRITLVEGTGADRRVILAREFECGLIIAPQYARLVEQVEAFSRNEFRQALVQLGLKPGDPAAKAPGDGDVSKEVEARLGRLVETEQFAAIRELHGSIRSKGEAPALLHALARAYANLGTLGKSQWTSDDSAFEARALLYAQRAFILDKGSPASLWARAYAEALTGMFREALEDLDNADKADGGKNPPGWAKALRAFCHSDAAALDAVIKDRPDDPLPVYLQFLTRLHSSGLRYENFGFRICREEIVTAGRAVLKMIPDYYRGYAGMSDLQGVSNMHQATLIGLELFAKAVPRRLASVPGLPPGVAKLVFADGAIPNEVELRRRLAVAAVDDPSDITWGVLARQFREIRFAQVCRRIIFIGYGLTASPEDFATDALPLVADHPYRAYVECFTKPLDGKQLVAVFKSLDLSDIVRSGDIFFSPVKDFDPALRNTFNFLDTAHDALGTVPGQEDAVRGLNPARIATGAHNLLRFNPDSPLGRAALIERNWDEAKPHVAAWEKDHGGDTLVLAQLGFHWLKEGKPEDAARYFEQALARSHDGWIFKALTDAYREAGMIDRWTKALDDFLKAEDFALDHARALEDLAKYLMEHKEFKKARLYAEVAAQSGAAWAMLCAAQCAEEMEDWDGAERWIAQTSERYPNRWLDWFHWCKRTGHGDARAAASLVEAQLRDGRSFSTESQIRQVAVVLILDQRPKEARKVLELFYKEKHGTMIGVLLALACDMDRAAAARDAALDSVRTEAKPALPKVARLFGVLGEWLVNGEKSMLDLRQVNEMLQGMPPANRASSAAFVGLLLDRHGKCDAAVEYLKKANVNECIPWFRLLAIDALRAKKIDPGPIPW